jgi:60 kDa SS-A/Ro ribonucleoprotein
MDSVYKVSQEELLKRFILLGTENGSYYITESELTITHISCLDNLIKTDYKKVIDIINTCYLKVYKKDYILFVIARCCADKNKDLRIDAYEYMLEICKIPTHLFLFIDLYERICQILYKSTGWNKLQKEYISKWYLNKQPMNLAYLITKYKNRNQWTHKDVLKLTHVKAYTDAHDALFAYITRDYDMFMKKVPDSDLQEYIEAYEVIKNTNDEDIAIALINQHKFVREHVSTQLLSNVHVWNALIPHMPMIALLRNLNKLTALGLFLHYPNSLTKIIDQLQNVDVIKKSKVHPLQILITLSTYSKGKGFKGKLEWQPLLALNTALNNAYRLSFVNVTPTNKRFLIALDVSSSMTFSSVCGIECMQASEIACAVAMIIAGQEPYCDVMGFSHEFKDLDISPLEPLEDNIKKVYNHTFGNTDISLPFLWALENKKLYDCFIVITDNDTNSNTIPPVEALRLYKEEMHITSKLIVIALCANKISIADPNDLSMLDIGGFDAETPLVINSFVSS